MAAALLFTATALQATEPEGNLIVAPGELRRQIEDRFGAKAEVRSLSVHPTVAEIEVRSATNKEHVDRYTFEEGRLSEEGEPVKVSADERRRLRHHVFPLSDLDLSLLPRLAEDAVARINEESGRVTHVLVERDEPGARPSIRVFVEGTRGEGMVEYSLSGKKRRVFRF